MLLRAYKTQLNNNVVQVNLIYQPSYYTFPNNSIEHIKITKIYLFPNRIISSYPTGQNQITLFTQR